ncbi:MAG: DegT/DnrJ/EryC1/StrS family aminotransferase [Planctomycetes bacterium]|nr:DegT/DnrJ/EryC1/StrS family aminotransferase [Planctomycetota bacterium]
MWVRKRLDIGWADFAAGAAACFTRWNGCRLARLVEQRWSDADEAVFTLSVRSAWDLLLGALDLPPGSEVLMSGLTIPDMVRIVEHRGLVPVPLDLELDTAAPSPETLRRAVTARTRVVLIAHLFGGRVDLGPLIEESRRHGLVFVEDCAQAYVGPAFTGTPEADASLFSFGTIKTATALGGGLARVRRRDMLERMRRAQEGYPRQSRWSFLRRVLKYSFLKLVSLRPLFAAAVRLCRWTGYDYDRALNAAVRGFGGEGVERFRRRPSAPLAALVSRRLSKYNARSVNQKTRRGELLSALIAPAVHSPGWALSPHNYWVFPVLSDDPPATVARLKAAGFDATQGQSMCVVPGPAGRDEIEPRQTRELLAKMIYVPLYPALPEREIHRLADVLRADAAARQTSVEAHVTEESLRQHDAAHLEPVER